MTVKVFTDSGADIPQEEANLTPQEIVDCCYGQMSSAAVPRYVLIGDALPVSGRGKVQKFRLKDLLAEKIESGEASKIIPSQAMEKKKAA